MGKVLDENEEIDEELASEGEAAGVEAEPESISYDQTEPFDPDTISIGSKIVSVDNILRRIKNKTIKLNPDFQRNFVWDRKRKGQLIESMILKIPLPMFYVAEDTKGVWEVVDGLQRLSTIRDFVIGPDGDGKGDTLEGLEFLSDRLKGKTFFALEKEEKAARILNNIMEAQLSFTIINPDTPEKVKRNIFKRINTGGMRLSDQEIRHALYQGRSTELLHRLVSSDEYLAATLESVKDSRMVGRELILRYIAFSVLGRKNLKSSMDDFLSNAMRYINGEEVRDIEKVDICIGEIESNFKLGLNRSRVLFGKTAFRKTVNEEKRLPVNKALFEVWINLLSALTEEEFDRVSANKAALISEYAGLLNKADFSNAISRYAGSQSGSNLRFDELSTLLKKFYR